MAARICRNCQIKFPPDNVINCRHCGETTVWKPYVSYDLDWEIKLSALQESEEMVYTLSPENQMRHDRAVAAGYTDTQAMFIAFSREIDLHQAEDLARHPRCGPDLAMKILA